MKITDFDEERHALTSFFGGILGCLIIFAFCSSRDRSAGEIIGVVVCLLILMAISAYARAENARYYLVDEDGITSCFFGGKLKLHFNWEDIRSLVVCNIYIRYKGSVCFLYLSTDDLYTMTRKQWNRRAVNLQFWHRKLVYFKFTMERYEYIRQYCALELMDRRKIQ